MRIQIKGDAKEIAAFLGMTASSERLLESKEFRDAVMEIVKAENTRRERATAKEVCEPELWKKFQQEYPELFIYKEATE